MTVPLLERLARINDPSLWTLIDENPDGTDPLILRAQSMTGSWFGADRGRCPNARRSRTRDLLLEYLARPVAAKEQSTVT
jgi:hypothetical protein